MPDTIPAGEGFLEAFVATARAAPERVFARFDGTAIGFGALDRRSASLAAALRAAGHGPGSRVAVMLRNSTEALVTILGLARAGLIWVPVNPALRGAGLRYILDHAGPGVLIVEHDLRVTVDACGAATGAMRIVTRTPDGGLAPIVTPAGGTGRALPADATGPALPAGGDLLAVMYTSGTTGPPKGVRVTHRMMRYAAEGVRRVAEAREGDVFFLWEPLCHIGGAQMIALPGLTGAQLAMTGRFSARRFWNQVAESGATHIHYLGGILQILLKRPPDRHERENRVRIAWGGGCPAEVFAGVRARFGLEPRECYGMTEMSSITTCSDGRTGGVIGHPLPWFAVTIRDSGGAPVPHGMRGEITVETADPGAFFSGYDRDPDATEKALGAGYLRTGDLGSRDPDGNLRFHGRLGDSLRCRGENVSAWEVEHVVAGHADVEDCAVIGVAAEIGEQEIMLYAKPRTGAALEPAALSAWLAPRLAAWQLPRYIVTVEAFERTPSQRIMKHRLPGSVAEAWDRMAAGPETTAD